MRRRWRRRSLKRRLRRSISYLSLWVVDVAILAALGATLIFIVVVMLGWRG
jgi:hypothetical protein